MNQNCKSNLIEVSGFGTLRPFYLASTEVTQQEYFAVMGENPSESLGDSKPVHNVSIYDAMKYCNKLSKKEGLSPYYIFTDFQVICNKNSLGYRLPTPDEWVLAGGDLMNCRNLDDFAWYKKTGKKLMEVGQKLPNQYGLYDMLGNVSEWCWDDGIFSDYGGNFKNDKKFLLKFENNGHCGDLSYNRVGFRIAKSIL